MSREERTFLIEDNLASGFEESLKEICMLASKQCGHEDVDGVANDLSFTIAKNLGEALASLKYLSNGLFVSAHMNDRCILAK